MKRNILFMWLLCGFVGTAQKMSFYDLEALAKKRTWEEIGKVIQAKGWVYDNSWNEATVYQTVGWAYKKTQKDDKAQMWFKAYILEGEVWGVSLQVGSRSAMDRIVHDAELEKFRKLDTEIFTGGTSVIYSRGSDWLEATTLREEKKNNFSSGETFHITLLRKVDIEKRCREVTKGEEKGCYYLLRKDLNGWLTVYYLRGSKKQESYYDKGEKQGHQRTFYPDGAIESDFCYEDDKLQDWGYTYHSNGQKETEKFYQKGLLEGESKDFYSDGSLKAKAFYVNDKLEGEMKSYYPSGKIQSVLFFKEGQLQGEAKWFHEQESVSLLAHYVDDKREGKATHFYPDGKIEKEQFFKNDMQQGEEKEYYNDGTLKSVIPFANGKAEGVAITYYANGNIEKETTYQKGQKNGEQKVFFLSGNLKHSEFYEKDKFVRREYLGGGYKCIELANSRERYEPIGESIKNKNRFEYVNEDENTREVRSLKEGLRHGKTTLYNLTTGEKIKEEKYEKGRLKK